MKKFVRSIVGLVVAGCAISMAQGAAPMLDPATDKPGEEWCYLGKSLTAIGVPFQPDVTQITFDGALYTRNAELCFFYGEQDEPLLARGKTFLDGWIPVVQYAWKDRDIAYDIEYFSSPLEGQNADNTVNFVQLRMRNTGTKVATGRFAAALRHNGGDYRNGGTPFSPEWRYEMSPDSVSRDGKLVYAFTPGANREAVPGVVYEDAFTGKERSLTPRSECCLARYGRELKPGESFASTFKMPRVPVATAAYDATLLGADYQAYRTQIIAYWTKLFHNTPVIELPEKRFQDAYRASLVHLVLATRSNGAGKRWQTDGVPYPDFFLTSVPEMAMMYLASGLPEYSTEMLVPGAIAQQQANGLYFDRAVAHGHVIPATQGHILYAISQTVLFTQDKAFAEKIYPSLQKGVGFIAQSMKTDEYGLLPPCWPYDAEMIDGHYTGQNMFALMGLRHAVRVARFLGKTDDVAAWTTLAEQFEANILKGIAASARPDGYIPTGLYKYTIGQASSRPDWEDYMYDADWENMILAWPTEVLEPTDPRVKGTIAHVRKDYAEGIMTYRHGLYLHQYITSNMIEQYLVMDDTYTALKDFYHQLLHSGSTHEAFENLVKPWTDRMVAPDCPPPHAWGTSKQGLMVRNFLLMEYGGKCGMETDRRELWLLHALSPAWVKPGEHVAIRNAPTEFGKISATMTFDKDGAQVTISSAFHEAPAGIRLRVPYFKELVSFRTDAKTSRQDGDCIIVSPDATTVRMEWRDKPGTNLHTVEDILTDYRSANRFLGVKDGKAVIKPGRPFLLDSEKSDAPQPLSFDLVRQTFQYEYSRLAKESGNLVEVKAPVMHVSSRPVTAANGWLVSASSSLPDHGPELAADGTMSLDHSWQADPYPQWIKFDLTKPTQLKGVQVWPYSDGERYYQYSVEVSPDGKSWEIVGDKLASTTPATAAGDTFEFSRREVRYIRVAVTHDSANTGVIITEVKTVESK
jgi:hypothetical protein